MPDFITPLRQSELMDEVQTNSQWEVMGKRNVSHYQFKFDYSTKSVHRNELDNQLPLWAIALLDQYSNFRPNQPRANQLTINRYGIGGGIAPHVDTHSSFLSQMLVFSLGSDVVMEFRAKKNGSYVTHNVLLPHGSLMILEDAARYGWEHCIRARNVDVIDGLVKRRDVRISLTFRSVRTDINSCDCDFKDLCK